MGKVIAVIPARGGSKRLPHKNKLILGDVPLVAHSINYALQNENIIDEVFLSSDDQELLDIAANYGATPIRRPDELSTDEQPTITTLQHALTQVDGPIDHVVLLQPTSPLRPKSLLQDAFEKYTSGNYDSLMTVTRVLEKLGRLENEVYVPFNYEFGQRSQDIEPLYYENGLLYITKSGSIVKGDILAENNATFVVDSPFAKLDIDTEEDFKYAQYLLQNKS